jgi:NosR/NirI family transcriptional regulator, nitrous oxide reductase regulator
MGVLALALSRQGWLSADPTRLAVFRIGYLTFTLVYIGWVAQGQLTIVTLTSLIEALVAGRGLEFVLADPVAVLLWAGVAATVLAWGRATFCGWWCPFGAFQELLSIVTRRLGWRPRHLHTHLDTALKKIKYAVLAVIVGVAAFSEPWSAQAVEFEPFKTAISLGFQREWPYVAWAVACLVASVFVFRGYCRYLCPLGAGLALLDRLRLRRWIPRRAECGTPCQTCRHRCEYQAIAPSGAIDYAECFQCLDCVGIHQDAKRCMPLIRERRQRVIQLQPVAGAT